MKLGSLATSTNPPTLSYSAFAFWLLYLIANCSLRVAHTLGKDPVIALLEASLGYLLIALHFSGIVPVSTCLLHLARCLPLDQNDGV